MIDLDLAVLPAGLLQYGAAPPVAAWTPATVTPKCMGRRLATASRTNQHGAGPKCSRHRPETQRFGQGMKTSGNRRCMRDRQPAQPERGALILCNKGRDRSAGRERDRLAGDELCVGTAFQEQRRDVDGGGPAPSTATFRSLNPLRSGEPGELLAPGIEASSGGR